MSKNQKNCFADKIKPKILFSQQGLNRENFINLFGFDCLSNSVRYHVTIILDRSVDQIFHSVMTTVDTGICIRPCIKLAPLTDKTADGRLKHLSFKDKSLTLFDFD